MGWYKLREWVGTVTGKGDRWGRDSVGRSAPAFMAASTTALPPLTCTARREASRHRLRLLLFAARPAICWLFILRPVPGGESAGCVCLQCLVQQAVCLFTLCLPCPLPSSFAPFKFALPRSFSLLCALPSVHVHVRQDHQQSKQHVCKLRDCPIGSCNTGLQWRPVHRVHLLTLFTLFLQSPLILGHGSSVRFIRISCLCKYECAPPACPCHRPAILVKSSE